MHILWYFYDSVVFEVLEKFLDKVLNKTKKISIYKFENFKLDIQKIEFQSIYI
jgi:hypothetical protein